MPGQFEETGFRMLRLPRLAAFALLCGVAVGGCQEKKTKESELQALAPDFQAISEQIKNTSVTSEVHQSGKKWTKFRLVPGPAKFQLTRTLVESESYKLTVAVKYRLEAIQTPVDTPEQARAAQYDSRHDLDVIAELVYQEGRWYLNSVTAQPPPGAPIHARTINVLLQDTYRRML
jgi:hypothetical protein